MINGGMGVREKATVFIIEFDLKSKLLSITL